MSQKAWHNEAGVSVALVIVLGCLLCCSNQWSEAGEGLGNLQELMLGRKEKSKRHVTTILSQNHYKMLRASMFYKGAT